MSAGFKAVQWNRRKIVYDAILISGVVLFVGTFMTMGALRNPPNDQPAWIGLRIKALGTCAFTMLTIILTIGPLARLSPRFLPLLYNRRHFGVLTFFVALAHAYSVVDWFAVQGAMGDLMNEMVASPGYGKFIGFPIKALGLTGLSVMFLLFFLGALFVAMIARNLNRVSQAGERTSAVELAETFCVVVVGPAADLPACCNASIRAFSSCIS